MAEDHDKERDDLTGIETTGHEWDGIKELDTPLPRWWLWTLYACIVWGIGYVIAYPAWPLISTTTQGVLGYSSRMELHTALTDHADAQKIYTDRIAAMEMDEIAADEELRVDIVFVSTGY